MREESWLHKLLVRIGLIKTYEVSKKSMCLKAQPWCNFRCESCAWKE